MKLVDDAKDWWKWHSTHVVGVAAVIPLAWQQMPHEFKALVPDAVMPYIGFVMFIAFLVARVRPQ